MSESLPEIGVIIAPAIRYVVRIHDDVLYEIEKSFIRSGIAGTSIVSAYIDMVAIRLRIARVFQADRGIVAEGDCISFAFYKSILFHFVNYWHKCRTFYANSICNLFLGNTWLPCKCTNHTPLTDGNTYILSELRI